MLKSRITGTVCCNCRAQLLTLFTDGLYGTLHRRAAGSVTIRPCRSPRIPRTRNFHVQKARQQDNQAGAAKEPQDDSSTASQAHMEALVREARQTFGETLPADLLSSQEYAIYERLYGPPLQETKVEDVKLLLPLEEESYETNQPRNMLLKENEDGDLEEIDYSESEEKPAGFEEDLEENETPQEENQKELRARMMLFKDIAAATEASRAKEDSELEKDSAEAIVEEEQEQYTSAYEDRERSYDDDLEDVQDDSSTLRTHPYTAAGRFSTSPATIFLPKDTFVEPIESILANASRKHLIEVAHRTFGGPGLPNSTATPSSKSHLRQQPIALEASQSKMGEMEANVYLGAIMPGAYAAVMSTLVETRKRLGSDWLADLLKKPGGPRVLDCGAGGAGVLAWRDVLRAEWERIHPEGVPSSQAGPLGKATVIIGSSELRHRASSLLENTTFLPRLPDYFPARDLVTAQDGEAPPRKQYDVIIAPHTLWTLKEDHMRKAQVQNLWSLLDPSGGVLIVIEKGVPRGFELVAGAREVLLKNQISSPEASHIENELQNVAQTRYTEKEEGMIIAPCTNHAQCPMYMTPGQSEGRKDHCHFSQRYIRPPFLQHLLGASDRNHEDIRFSYIAFRRGKDLRRTQTIRQGDSATDAAFEGYELYEDDILEDTEGKIPEPKDPNQPNMLSLPRALLPPLKRHGHVILDLCTPSGKLERWTVPKSFSKQAYRDARKSRWGDLWALGAKTRVPRTARVGNGKDGKKAKRVIEVGVGADESEDRIRELPSKGARYEKRSKKGRAKKRPRTLKEDDL